MIRRNFTLTEILMVLGLMAILLFIALPAFEKLAKGHGVELAARNLTSKLGQARGYAITTREYVALLMPTAISTTPAIAGTTPGLPEYAFKGYKLCVVTAGSTSPFIFKRWIPTEKWEFLPTGTAINHINDISPHTAGSDSNSTTDATWTTALLEVVNDVNLTEIGHADVDNVRAIVFKPTGKMAITGNRYVAVSESTYNGTNLTATNPKNWIDITIDQFTGRVTYGAE
jgi:hypothetical protein